MRILILGAGATGGYFGGRLAEAGNDVTFLVRPGRAKQLESIGLKLKSQFGDFESKNVKVVQKAEHKYDLIMLSCKAWDLKSAMQAIAPAVGDDTTILPLLNGMSHLPVLEKEFGKQHVIGGFCVISATLGADGSILHLNDRHTIKYGEFDGEISERIKAIDDAHRNAKCVAQASTQITADMWEKWVMISSLAALTTLMHGTIGEIAKAPYGPSIAANLFSECLNIAQAHGNSPAPSFISSFRDRLLDPESALTASMLRDMQREDKIEADHIIGDLIERAKEKEIATPILEIVYCHLKTYEARRSSVSGGAA